MLVLLYASKKLYYLWCDELYSVVTLHCMFAADNHNSISLASLLC